MNTFNQNHSGQGDNVMNFGLQPRKLNEDLKIQLKELIKEGSSVDITAGLGDGEAYSFASEIKGYLEGQGYKVNGVSQAVFSGPVKGQIIEPPKEASNDSKVGKVDGKAQEGNPYRIIIGNNQ